MFWYFAFVFRNNLFAIAFHEWCLCKIIMYTKLSSVIKFVGFAALPYLLVSQKRKQHSSPQKIWIIDEREREQKKIVFEFNLYTGMGRQSYLFMFLHVGQFAHCSLFLIPACDTDGDRQMRRVGDDAGQKITEMQTFTAKRLIERRIIPKSNRMMAVMVHEQHVSLR